MLALFVIGAWTMWVVSQLSPALDVNGLGRNTVTFLLPALSGLFVVGAGISLFKSEKATVIQRLLVAISLGLVWLIWVHTRDNPRRDNVDTLFLITIPAVLLSLAVLEIVIVRSVVRFPNQS